MIIEKTLDGSVRLTVTMDEYETLRGAALIAALYMPTNPRLRPGYHALLRELDAGLLELDK